MQSPIGRNEFSMSEKKNTKITNVTIVIFFLWGRSESEVVGEKVIMEAGLENVLSYIP